MHRAQVRPQLTRLDSCPCCFLMDRRHWFLLLAALACIASLLVWVGDIDLGMEESVTPPATPTTPAQP